MTQFPVNLFTSQIGIGNIGSNSLSRQEQKVDTTFDKTMDKVNKTHSRPRRNEFASKKDIKNPNECKVVSTEKNDNTISSNSTLKETKSLSKKESILNLDENQKNTLVAEDLLSKDVKLEELMPLLGDLDLEKIMALLPVVGTIMEHLNVSLEQVVNTLKEMGIESKDLSDPKLFSAFISELYGKDMEGLLMESGELKNINKLLEKIQHITENMHLSDKQVAIEKIIIGDQIVAESSKIANVPIQPQEMEQDALTEQATREALTRISKETKLSSEGLNNAPEVTKELTSTGFGFQIPIAAVEQNMQAKLWNEPDKAFPNMQSMKNIDIHNQIIEKINLKTLQEGKEINMELSPRELGKLTMKLTEHQGMITASIKVDNEKTKEMLIQNLAQLKNNLETQGLTVGSFEVNVREDKQKFEMEKQKQKSSKRIGELLEKHLNEIEEEIEEAKTLNETEIDYMV